jgi:hypothetical protein
VGNSVPPPVAVEALSACFLCGVDCLVFCGKGAIAATKVGGAVFHEEGGEFTVNAIRQPGCRDADDTGAIFPQERPKIFDVGGANDASLLDSLRAGSL